MSKLAHASTTKQHDDYYDFHGTLDELLSGVASADDLLDDQGLMMKLKVWLMERILGAELSV